MPFTHVVTNSALTPNKKRRQVINTDQVATIRWDGTSYVLGMSNQDFISVSALPRPLIHLAKQLKGGK